MLATAAGRWLRASTRHPLSAMPFCKTLPMIKFSSMRISAAAAAAAVATTHAAQSRSSGTGSSGTGSLRYFQTAVAPIVKPKTESEQRIEHKLTHYYDVNRYRESLFCVGGPDEMRIGDCVHVVSRRSAARESRALLFAGVVTRIRTRGVATNFELLGLDAGMKVRRRFYAFSPLTYRVTRLARSAPPEGLDFIQRIVHEPWDNVDLRLLAARVHGAASGGHDAASGGGHDAAATIVDCDGVVWDVPEVVPAFAPDLSDAPSVVAVTAITPREMLPLFVKPHDVLTKGMRGNIKRRVRYNRDMDAMFEGAKIAASDAAPDDETPTHVANSTAASSNRGGAGGSAHSTATRFSLNSEAEKYDDITDTSRITALEMELSRMVGGYLAPGSPVITPANKHPRRKNTKKC